MVVKLWEGGLVRGIFKDDACETGERVQLTGNCLRFRVSHLALPRYRCAQD